MNSSEKTCSAQTEWYTDRDGDAGKFSIVGLEWGEYQLIESKAPDGYNIDTTPHVFRIGPAEGANVKGDVVHVFRFQAGDYRRLSEVCRIHR